MQTPHFYLIRKPSGLPSTHGQDLSFLDHITQAINASQQNNSLSQKFSKEFLQSCQQFGIEQEYGLLNRLDNATSWLLYFAKSPEDKRYYITMQKQKKLTKYYVAEVYGRVASSFGRIQHPIAHHPTDKKKMVALQDATISYRSKPQQVVTYYELLAYDAKNDVSILHVEITKWARHQIRCHLASMRHPIVNDPLYTTKRQRKKLLSLGRYDKQWTLGLTSVGMRYAKETIDQKSSSLGEQ